MNDSFNARRLNKSLCDEMPYLMPRNIFTDKVPEDYNYEYICGEYELPKGWIPLFLQMCVDIRQPLIDADYLDKFRFSQIKEKYNSMRCYTFGAPRAVQDIIDKYEYLSRFICQECGKPATKETFGWIASYCDECCPDNEDTEHIELNPIMHVRRYKEGKGYDEYIDYSDEWRRYINENFCSK